MQDQDPVCGDIDSAVRASNLIMPPKKGKTKGPKPDMTATRQMVSWMLAYLPIVQIILAPG